MDSSSQRLVLMTPQKVFNKHYREIDDNDDFVVPVHVCVSLLASIFRPSHEIPIREDDDNDFLWIRSLNVFRQDPLKEVMEKKTKKDVVGRRHLLTNPS